MNKTLGVVVGEPPRALQHARLDNIALVPASLLPYKGRYQSLANTYPTGSVLCIQGTQRQQKIMEKVTSLFRDHGRSVITLPLERITRKVPKSARSKPENLSLAF
jgi:hypothetical protein